METKISELEENKHGLNRIIESLPEYVTLIYAFTESMRYINQLKF
jgi:hypothetical protein